MSDPRTLYLNNVRVRAWMALAMSASQAEPVPIEECVRLQDGMLKMNNRVMNLAMRALAASLNAGNWREQRAEAECKLRHGWVPVPAPATDGSISKHYAAAKRAVGPMPSLDGNNEYARLEIEHRWRRKVSVVFHRNLARAGIYVEGA